MPNEKVKPYNSLFWKNIGMKAGSITQLEEVSSIDRLFPLVYIKYVDMSEYGRAHSGNDLA